MNQKTHFTLSFYHLTLAIRDTIEYVQKRNSYPLPIYLAKKHTLEMSLRDTSPFMNFCKNNGEIGEKMHDQLQELYDIVYGEDQTFVSIEGNEVKPDAAQNLKVLDYIIPLRQSLYNILRAYIDAQRKDGSYEEGIEEIVNLEDKFYRCIFFLVISDYLFNNLFQEFNKIMRENQGQETIQSNFVTSDIKKSIGMINFIKKNYQVADFEFDNVFMQVERGIKLISGQDKVPEGSTFQQEFQKICGACYQLVAKLEPEWRQKHIVIWNQLIEFEKQEKERLEEKSN